MSVRTRHPQLVAWSCRVYSVLLWAYPPSLRREFRRELLLTFRNRTEDVVNSGSMAIALMFAAHLAADWMRTFALEREDTGTLSLLGLGSGETEACGCLDRSTFSVSLFLATLGVALLIGGWYEWLTFKALLLSHHRAV